MRRALLHAALLDSNSFPRSSFPPVSETSPAPSCPHERLVGLVRQSSEVRAAKARWFRSPRGLLNCKREINSFSFDPLMTMVERIAPVRKCHVAREYFTRMIRTGLRWKSQICFGEASNDRRYYSRPGLISSIGQPRRVALR